MLRRNIELFSACIMLRISGIGIYLNRLISLMPCRSLTSFCRLALTNAAMRFNVVKSLGSAKI